MTAHWCLCSAVPVAALHSWHRSPCCQSGSCALRACGHCPPLIADFRLGRCLGCQDGYFLAADFAFLYSGLSAGVRSTSVRLSRATLVGGAALGSSAIACFMHHRLTEREAAAATARGESKAASYSWPRSSRNLLPSDEDHPIRRQVATRAVAGPLTRLQTVPLAFASLSAAAT